MAPPTCLDNMTGQNGIVQVVVDRAEKKTQSPSLLDADEFRRQSHQVVDLIAEYYDRMGDYPVHPTVTPGFLRNVPPPPPPPPDAPFRPEPDAFSSALKDVRDIIIPGLTHWQSARHMAHFPASSSTIGALGEALTAGINVVPFTWAASPAATELEMLVVDWLGKALHLPESLLFAGGGGGTLLGTSCEAILCTLVAARDRKLAEIGERRICDLVVYCSDQTHFAFRKAARIAGILRDHCRAIPTCHENMFALSPKELEAALQADVEAGLVPLFLCATLGTTQTTAVDPIAELCAVTAPHGVWVHVDAAYAGSALVCPEFTHLIDGVEAVDSFSMNAHKWLLANNDCCAMWVKKPSALVAALGPEQDLILKDAASEGQNMWLVLRCYGIQGLRDHIRSHVRMAEAFEKMVKADERFKVVTDRKFALVCFRLRSQDKFGGADKQAANRLNRRLLEEVNAATSGPYMSSATVGGMFILRCAIGSTLTEEHHVSDAWKVVQDQATIILRNN
ncbi:hypothetical protein VPH35_075774 [Triticum aestivum]